MTQKQHLQLCISLALCGYLEAFTALFYNCLGLFPSVECKLLRAIFKPLCSDYPKNVWMWGSMDKIPSKSKRQEPLSSLIPLRRKVWPLVWFLRNQFWSSPIRRHLCRMYCLWKEAWSQACHYNWEFTCLFKKHTEHQPLNKHFFSKFEIWEEQAKKVLLYPLMVEGCAWTFNKETHK